MTYAVIPAKGFRGAKQRLAAILQPDERHLLAQSMLTDTLIACSNATQLEGYGVVTSDTMVAEVATSCDADVIWEPQAGGHSQAVSYAVRTCCQRGVTTLLTIPGDLPLITPADIEAIAAPANPLVSVILVPNRDELGTNAMVLSPPDCLPLQFGYHSFQRHLRLAAEHHLTIEVRRTPRVALDIDEPEDLARFAAQHPTCHSFRLLDDLGVLDRLAKIPITSTQENLT